MQSRRSGSFESCKKIKSNKLFVDFREEMEYTLEQLKDLTRELEIHGAAQEQLSNSSLSRNHFEVEKDLSDFEKWTLE